MKLLFFDSDLFIIVWSCISWFYHPVLHICHIIFTKESKIHMRMFIVFYLDLAFSDAMMKRTFRG